jgi:hypothetical protein
MKTGAQIGVAVAAGYVLGRFHKLKWAVALGTMAGRKKLAGQQSALLGKGAKLLGSSDLGPVTQELRGQLLEAGKAAAVTAVSSKINSLSDSLQERSQTLRAASGKAGGAGPGDSDEPDETEEPDDLEDRDDAGARDEADAAGEPDGGEPDDDEAPAVPEQRRRPRGRDRDSGPAHDTGKERDTDQERRSRAADRRPAASRGRRGD